MKSLLEIANFNGQVFQNEPLANWCTYKIGGQAKYFAKVNNEASLSIALKWASENNIDTFILGGGSNVLFADEGFNGLVILLDGDFNHIDIDKMSGICEFGAAVSLSKAMNSSLDENLSGLEFCAGIPGTVGGAVKMNAGRKEDWVSSVLSSVKLVSQDGNSSEIQASDIDWGYRKSSIEGIVVSAKFELKCADDSEIEQIHKKIEEMKEARRNSQPSSKPCCGSVFKNPEAGYAGQLIEDCELKGLSVGGAKVSDLHANFIVNENNATAKDVIEIITKIQKTVYDKKGIELHPELKFVGFNESVGLF